MTDKWVIYKHPTIADAACFPKVGGKKLPWYTIANSDTNLNVSYTIYSGHGERRGVIDDDCCLWVFDNPFHRGQARDTTRIFDVNSYDSILQAVRLAMLMTQEEVSHIRSQRLQERLMRVAIRK